MPSFYADFENENGRNCAEDVAAEIEKLKSENVNGIILDLRNNGGGSLRDVVRMTGFFIEKGPIVQVKSRNQSPDVMPDNDPGVQYDGPLVVMVNSNSASASEIIAAALQDYNRAVIVGTPTFGKGTVQRFIDLDRSVAMAHSEVKPLGNVKLTMQKFYRINGGSTQLKGVTPDIVMPDAYAFIETGALQTGNIILNGVLTASGNGTPLVLAAGASFINNAGGGALVTTDPSARWLVYSDHPILNTLGGLTSDFSIYRCNYNGTCPTALPASGKGLLYQYGPVIVQIAVDTTRTYGDANPSGTQLKSLYTYTGLQNGDTAAALDVLPTVSVTGLTANSTAGSVGTLVLTGGSDDV